MVKDKYIELDENFEPENVKYRGLNILKHLKRYHEKLFFHFRRRKKKLGLHLKRFKKNQDDEYLEINDVLEFQNKDQ